MPKQRRAQSVLPGIKEMAARHEIALKVLPSLIAESLPLFADGVRTADHRALIAASLEDHAPGTALRVLQMVERGKTHDAVEALRVALIELDVAAPELMRTPSLIGSDALRAAMVEWYQRPLNASDASALDYLGPGAPLLREYIELRKKLRMRAQGGA